MPEISRFHALVIQMYFHDHAPPHFHVRHGHGRARMGIAPVLLLDGTLPPRLFSLAERWATLHQAELLENWHRMARNQPPLPIAPLE